MRSAVSPPTAWSRESNVGTALRGWHVEAAAELGRVVPQAAGGIVQDMSTLTTSGFSLGVRRRLEHGLIRISLSQPPRVERGSTKLSLPVGRTREGEVLRENLNARLVPSGRQMDLAVRWYQPHVFGGEFRAEATVSRASGSRRYEPGTLAARGLGERVLIAVYVPANRAA